ncbi:topoisomerase C-terminal repeat-containing protein [Hymenobacter humi]|uniref:Topoisomerase C-terminal repeat-containing protein n=1 Tax=Hymenobacter humi TaxID=1411620 RepID=A0ABW2UBG9_9BACT
MGQHQAKPVVVGQSQKEDKAVYVRWNDKFFKVPSGIEAATVTLAQAVQLIIQAQEQAARNVLATVGKYTIGKNEWGLYVSDGEVKAKFKPGVTEDEAKATDAATCAEMIKNYKAWKKKNAGKK